MPVYGCFLDPQRGVWPKTYHYSCKPVAFLLAANEKNVFWISITLSNHVVVKTKNWRWLVGGECFHHCIWLCCWLPIWGLSMWCCCLYPFFMKPNCKWSALVSGDKLWPIWKERRLGTGLIVGLNCWDVLFTWVNLNEKFLVFC